jgi:hypothetical protein
LNYQAFAQPPTLNSATAGADMKALWIMAIVLVGCIFHEPRPETWAPAGTACGQLTGIYTNRGEAGGETIATGIANEFNVQGGDWAKLVLLHPDPDPRGRSSCKDRHKRSWNMGRPAHWWLSDPMATAPTHRMRHHYTEKQDRCAALVDLNKIDDSGQIFHAAGRLRGLPRKLAAARVGGGQGPGRRLFPYPLQR